MNVAWQSQHPKSPDLSMRCKTHRYMVCATCLSVHQLTHLSSSVKIWFCRTQSDTKRMCHGTNFIPTQIAHQFNTLQSIPIYLSITRSPTVRRSSSIKSWRLDCAASPPRTLHPGVSSLSGWSMHIIHYHAPTTLLVSLLSSVHMAISPLCFRPWRASHGSLQPWP